MRLLSLIALALVFGLVISAPASARTVYDYVYSGTYIDGSDSGSTFTCGVAGLAFDSDLQLYVSSTNAENCQSPVEIAKFDLAGKAVDFSALGSPRLTVPAVDQVAVDRSGTATDGNLYVGAAYFGQAAYEPSGIEIPGFAQPVSTCGVAVDSTGQPVITGSSIVHLDNWASPTYDFPGTPALEPGVKVGLGSVCRPAVDGNGDLYLIEAEGNRRLFKATAQGLEQYELNSEPTTTAVAVDASNQDVFVLKAKFESYNSECPSCVGPVGAGTFDLFDGEGRLLGGGWGAPDPSRSYLGIDGNRVEGPYNDGNAGSSGIAVDPTTHDVWIANKRAYAGGVRHLEKFVRTNPHVIPDTTALPPALTDPNGESATLRGIVNPDGVTTTDCRFEYGVTQKLGNSAPCAEGDVFGGSTDQQVSAAVPTAKGKRYFFRLVAENANGQDAPSNPQHFLPQGKPKVPFVGVDRINTDGARLRTTFDPNGGNATYQLELGQEGDFEVVKSETDTVGFSGNTYLPGTYPGSVLLDSLTPGTTYEYRASATNEAGTTTTAPRQFTTYLADPGSDACPNAQVRQQTEGSLLPDCRAYELVSAADTGGFDVESDLVQGQAPLDAYPEAGDKLLYSLHFGVIPGVEGSPTNHGLDPYVATRGADGWSTEYVGVPADGMVDKGTFGSPLLGADAALATFAFGGPGICDPCFDDGTTNVPLRLPDGTRQKGMAGDPSPAADPAGEVRRPLSPDGSHLIFGSESSFAPGGSDGSLAIYDRNLATGRTQLVSTDQNGTALVGELAGLDISPDGNRILVGRKVGEDAAGNVRFDLFMHIGDDSSSVVVADTPSGVVYNGMTSDGSAVFFTTADALDDDSDTSADFYRADVGSPGAISSVTRLSTGTAGAGNTDACTPVVDWNVVSGGPDCSTVALAGGAGIASGDGTSYFVSPEGLDGSSGAEAGQPNLFVVRPGEEPRFVGTIDSSAVKPGPQPEQHPIVATAFGGTFSAPEGLAVDQSNGDVYVVERDGSRLTRLTSAGAAHKFTAGPGAGTNQITGLDLGAAGRAQVAVDNAPGSAFEGDFYVKSSATEVSVFAADGEKRGALTGFTGVCGLAVDQSSGALYVADAADGSVWRFAPSSPTGPITNADYIQTGIHTEGLEPCSVAADTVGNVYATGATGGPVLRFVAGQFGAGAPTVAGELVDLLGYALATDPATDDLYVNEGTEIARFDSSGGLIQRFGATLIGTDSRGIAVNASNGHLFVPNASQVVRFGSEEVPYEPIDNPAVVHGVNRSAVHSYGDFQVTADGGYAVFSSVVPLTGQENLGHSQVFRYDAEADQLACVSCAPTGAVGSSDVSLTAHGLNLADDGRVFFSTFESLTLRDTNEKKDAYEWSAGKVSLISPGVGQFDSSLATVSSDGSNAFFYTRDKLVPTDKSEGVVKVYTAREGGGFLFDPPTPPCAASDECHGAGSKQPSPPNINSFTGAGAGKAAAPARPVKCRKRFVKRRGVCVKRKPGKARSKSKARNEKGRR